MCKWTRSHTCGPLGSSPDRNAGDRKANRVEAPEFTKGEIVPEEGKSAVLIRGRVERREKESQINGGRRKERRKQKSRGKKGRGGANIWTKNSSPAELAEPHSRAHEVRARVVGCRLTSRDRALALIQYRPLLRNARFALPCRSARFWRREFFNCRACLPVAFKIHWIVSLFQLEWR